MGMDRQQPRWGHKGLDLGDRGRWEAVGMAADGGKGGGMEGEGSRAHCAPAGWWQWWQVPTGERSGALHLTRCVPFTEMWGAGSCWAGIWGVPIGVGNPNPASATETHPSEQGSFWSRWTSSLPHGSPPQLLLLQKPGRRPVFPRKRSQEDSSWIQPQDPSQSSAII